MTYYSQEGQDRILEESFFRGHKNGFFMDVGAYDGKSINNTLFFEETHQWTGINVDANKAMYDRLVVNRPNCINLYVACSDKEGTAEFIMNDGYTDAISGLKEHYDPRHSHRLNWELAHHGGSTRTVEVPTTRIETICDKYNVKHINYLSIDVEGGEMAVIQGINFDKVFIDIIGFENNYPDVGETIVQYLLTKGYYRVHIQDRPNFIDIFMVHKDSEFLKRLQ